MIVDANEVPLFEGVPVRVTGAGWGVRGDHVGKTGITKRLKRGGASWEVVLDNNEGTISCKTSQIIRSFPQPDIRLMEFWGDLPALRIVEEGYHFTHNEVAHLQGIHNRLARDIVRINGTPAFMALVDFSKSMLSKQTVNGRVKMEPAEAKKALELYFAFSGEVRLRNAAPATPADAHAVV